MSVTPLSLDRIRELSVSDRDLIRKDRESSERYVFSRHCQRVWEKLTTEERDLIRLDVTSRNADHRSCRFIDIDCLDELGRMIHDTKSFPSEHLEQEV